MFLYIDSKLHKGRSNVVAAKDYLSTSPVKGVKRAGKGMSLGTKGGVIVGVKSVQALKLMMMRGWPMRQTILITL